MTLRVLILEDDPMDALAMRRELSDRYDVTVAATLDEGLLCLQSMEPLPDVVITDLFLPDSTGPRTLERLHDIAAQIPIIVSTGHLNESVRRQLDGLGAAHLHDKSDGYALLRMILRQTTLFQEAIINHKREIILEIDRVAREAGREAADTAIAQLLNRLGLDDEEGMRMAVRLARGWDAAKTRFVSAIATGLAGALLLAIGAGIAAMLRNHVAR